MILTEISLKRPVFATVLILALVVLGLTSYLSLNVDEWPDVEFPYVTVQITYKGAAPEQVESKVLQKVEEAVSSISGVKHIYSTAREGVAITTVEFSLETVPNVAAQDVRDKLGRIRSELPQDIDEPVIMRFDPSEAPIASLVVTGKLSVREMTTLVDDVIKRRLEAISGVGAVEIRGAATREIQLNLSRDKLAAYGLTTAEVAENLKGENMEVPAGKLTAGTREVSVRTMGNLPVAQNFLQAPVARRNGVQLYFSHIGSVTDGVEEVTSVARLNGKPALGLDIMKQSGSNTLQVAKEVKQAIATMQTDLPPGVELVLVRDNSKNIRQAVDDVLSDLVTGGALAVAIVFLFLGNWRSTLISAIAIPASIIATFFMMKLMNFTINTMSLMALSLAVGLLIDDAIVVIENIVRHMEMGKDRRTAASEGTQEIGLAVTATTLTLVAVFVPVGMMTGVVGQFFKQFGLTVAFAVLVSLFIAFTLTPLMSAAYLQTTHGQRLNRLGRMLLSYNQAFDRVTAKYGRFLRFALAHRLKVLAAAGVLFVVSLSMTALLGSGFLGRTDNAEFTAVANVDAGVSVAGAAELADRMSAIIRTAPEVTITYSVANADTIRIFARLTEKRERRRSDDAIMAALRTEMNSLPGVKVSMMKKAGIGEDKPVSLVLRGENLDTLATLAEQAQKIMEEIPGAVDVTSTHKPGQPDVQVVVRQDRAADLGVATGTIADTLRTLFTGLVVSQYKDGDDRYDVRLRLAERERTGLQDLNGIYLPGKYKDAKDQTVMVPLSQVTQTIYATSPSEIHRQDRLKQITISANLEGVSLGEFNKHLFSRLKAIEVPVGYTVGAMGESERMGETFTSIGIALFIAVVFIFFVLAAQFESYIDPFSIMLSLPLAIIGAIMGLLVMGSELSLMSLIGIIMLMGLVTKNAILLVDFAKNRYAQGVSLTEALVEAAHTRMRPIMMTTAAMIFGMLPLATGLGTGAEGRAPMAHAIIGGLITSTVLTLVVVPVVYSLLYDGKQWVNKQRFMQQR